MLLVVLSEIGQSKNKESLKSTLEEKLVLINKDLINYKRISTVIIVKDDWNPENEILTPTLKIKRGKVNDKYTSQFSGWNDSDETVIWEQI